MSDWIEEGQAAPDFTLAADDGKKVKLSALRGSPVVLYFYPKDDTPGCTIEACAFRDRSGELQKLGVKVLGVSPDDVKSHVGFRDKFKLNFPLLADLGHKIADKYGVWREKNMYGKKTMGIQRSTFLIDANGRVAKAWKAVQVDGHDGQVIKAIEALRKPVTAPKAKALPAAKAKAKPAAKIAKPTAKTAKPMAKPAKPVAKSGPKKRPRKP